LTDCKTNFISLRASCSAWYSQCLSDSNAKSASTECLNHSWTLQHACKVIRPGRSFLRRAISLLSVAKRPHHHIRLNHGFKSDLMWWKVFSTHWNGASLLVDPFATPQVVLTSDASGSWGCGAWCGSTWFQLQWDNSSGLKQITEKELLPIIIAAAIWGHSWGGGSRWLLGVTTQQLSQ